MSFQCLACNEFTDDVIGPNTSFEICYDCCGFDADSDNETVEQIEQLLRDNEFIQSIFYNDILEGAESNMQDFGNEYITEDMIDEDMTEDTNDEFSTGDIDINEYFNVDMYVQTYDNDTDEHIK
jgi:hypothetical protein